ncbi:uncharacterized protein DS421_13g413520 [Arachis hypogaea]|nr:uncharacterized protein DS421_13g413520 [Arachis hypogaea]
MEPLGLCQVEHCFLLCNGEGGHIFCLLLLPNLMRSSSYLQFLSPFSHGA